MQNFENIEQIYTYLESNCLNYAHSYNIKELFVNENDKINQNKYHFEQTIFYFYFCNEDSKVKPAWIFADGCEIPDKNNLSDEFYDYLKKRQKDVQHPFLKSYYSHLLWGLNHKRFGEDAIKAYLELIGIYEKGQITKKDLDFEICNTIKYCCVIAFSINSKMKEQCKTKMLEILLTSFEKKDYYSLISLTSFALDNFKTENIENLQNKCFSFFDESEANKDFEKIELLKLGKKIDQKLHTNTYNWLLEIAKVYERMSIERKDLANINFCLEALAIYENLGIQDKILEMQIQYKQIREKMEFSEIYTKVDFKILIDQVERLSKDFNNTTETITFLVNDKEWFLLKLSQINDKTASFLDVIPSCSFDNKGHKNQEFNTEKELKNYKILSEYSFLLPIRSFLLTNFLKIMLNSEILTLTDLKEYFVNNSWLGQEIENRVANKTYCYKWLDFITPSLEIYFQEINKQIENNEYQPSFILFIDSLTPKIEGIIRTIFEFNGGNTSKFKTGQKKNLTVEKDINQLFADESIKELIDEDTLFFLKFLLVEKVGFNLRNKVAHCLMEQSDYTFQIANLLLLALIKLSNYQFKNQNANEPSSTFKT